MTMAIAGKSRVIDAPAEVVYAVLADYREGHPRILPERYFTGLEVEEGGRGEGTVIRYGITLLGRTMTARARVEEPEPGRTLTETDLANGAVTTFRVQPLERERTRLTITTAWPARGVRGAVERLLVPRLLRRVYEAEMDQLERYVRASTAAAA